MKKGKVLCLDYGSKYVGVATGDFQFRIAFPRGEFANDGVDSLLADVSGLCDELSVAMVVIGLPLNMNEGQAENPILSEIRSFGEKLCAMDYEVEFVDERLSSFEAKNLVNKREKVDSVAAQIILQRYFDELAN